MQIPSSENQLDSDLQQNSLSAATSSARRQQTQNVNGQQQLARGGEGSGGRGDNNLGGNPRRQVKPLGLRQSSTTVTNSQQQLQPINPSSITTINNQFSQNAADGNENHITNRFQQ